MRQLGYILTVLLLALTACSKVWIGEDELRPAPEGERVLLTFQVAVPDDEAGTRALGNNPVIDNLFIAVFGGSGYFNEWVRATEISATHANYDGTSATVYEFEASFSVSNSRLRLHFIANCPKRFWTSPPISGSQDTEENVISKIRTSLDEGDSHSIGWSDGYWQKVVLPKGISADKVIEGETVTYVPTNETLLQFPSPIPLVRNFARVYIKNLTPFIKVGSDSTQLVRIEKYALAYEPIEGTIAPIVSEPYVTDEWGTPTVDTDSPSQKIYYENFLTNYQRYKLESTTPSDTTLVSAPFFYGGYTPADVQFAEIPDTADMKEWDFENPANNVLFVYERRIPTATQRATRVLIYAERADEGLKYYALDIVNDAGLSVPLLRNQSYTVRLLNIEAGAGEANLNDAAAASSATVIGDPNYQELTQISDGVSSIGTSFTEMFYVSPQEDSVMFRFIPTNVGDTAGEEDNSLVNFRIGTVDTQTGVFTPVNASNASSNGILAFDLENGDYKISISKDQNDQVIQYVRSNNAWVSATAAQIANPDIEKWGMVKYTLNRSIAAESASGSGEYYFTQERTQAIQIYGTYGTKEMSRNVIIKLSPRQELDVVCLQKYVPAAAGQQEVVRIKIPTGLSRAVFPLDFQIEPNGYSLTPNGDVLPVTSGTSIDPNNNGPAYYFIKELTREEYDALSMDGDMKYFDCHFKTTVANNACTVFVRNRYFQSDGAQDNFYNYVQREFSNLAFSPTDVYKGQNVNFTFKLDQNHGSSANKVWWDSSTEENREAGISTSNRVLPRIITVILTGLAPQDGFSMNLISGTYRYYLTDDDFDAEQITLRLRATGAANSTAKVELSTRNLTDNPNLYADNNQTFTIRTGATFTNVALTPAAGSTYYGTNQNINLTFTYQTNVIVPITLDLTGLVPTGSDNRLVSTGVAGQYTFTPTASDISGNVRNQTIALRTNVADGGVSASLSADAYNTASTSHTALTISLNKSSTEIHRGRTETLTATLTPADASGQTISWTSSDPTIASVNGSGVVTANAVGTATITATACGKTATCAVTVIYVPVTGVTVTPANATLIITNTTPSPTTQLSATVAPANASDQTVTWLSTNTAVATVDDNGLVSAVAPGTATIKATTADGGFTASSTVTVRRRRTVSLDTNSGVSGGSLKAAADQTRSSGDVSIVFSSLYNVNAGYVRPARNNNTITIRANNKEIVEVKINFTGVNYTHNYTVNTGTRSLNGTVWTWTGSTQELIATSTSRDARISSIEVSYYDDN